MYKVTECSKCRGNGYIVHKGIMYRFVRTKCVSCDGKGVIKTVILR